MQNKIIDLKSVRVLGEGARFITLDREWKQNRVGEIQHRERVHHRDR